MLASSPGHSQILSRSRADCGMFSFPMLVKFSPWRKECCNWTQYVTCTYLQPYNHNIEFHLLSNTQGPMGILSQKFSWQFLNLKYCQKWKCSRSWTTHIFIVVERCSDAVTYVLRFVGLRCGRIGLLDGVYEGHRDVLWVLASFPGSAWEWG